MPCQRRPVEAPLAPSSERTIENRQPLAAIDAALEVVPPGSEPAAMTAQQAAQLEECQVALSRIAPRIAARESELRQRYLECGWWLLRAREIHRSTTVGHRSDGTFPPSENGGFYRWLTLPEISIAATTAERRMWAARNMGLTHESTTAELTEAKKALKLTDLKWNSLCRKPPNKKNQMAEVCEETAEEEDRRVQQELHEFWRGIAEQIADKGITEKTWVNLTDEALTALRQIAFAWHSELAATAKMKPLPGPKSRS